VLTSKRLVMLVTSFVVLVTAYVGYARSYVGAIDGLPALPERFRKGEPGAEATPPVHAATRDAKLKQAFGEECEELSRPFRLEVRTQGMVLSSGTPQVQEDGTVRLEPVSIALFGKHRSGTRMVEINTVRGKTAILTFEHPVKNESDIGASKVIRATLEENIVVVNNRSTPERDDDLVLTVKKGPLVFDDEQHTLTTDDEVHVVDKQSKPNPIVVDGTGMRVDLITDPPAKGSNTHAARNRNDPIRGVKRVTLNTNVAMFLYAEGKNNFLGNSSQPTKDPKGAKNDKEAQAAADKDLIKIRTRGPFRYDLEKDHDFARFEAPPQSANVPEQDRQVFVERIHVLPKGASDKLHCQVLELRLHRKDSSKESQGAQAAAQATGPRPDQGLDRGLDIEWAHATGDPVPGRLVTIQSDTESLVEAEGTEFTYEAPPQPAGGPSLTTLTGTRQRSMRAVSRDGTIITALQVKIKDQKSSPTGDKVPGHQEGTATGPGVVDFIDRKDPKNVKIQHAWFRDWLISDQDDGKDRMTLIGDARFVDETPSNDPTAGPTSLEADILKVWLDVPDPEAPRPENATPANEADDPDDEDAPPANPGRRPHHVEAIGKVNAHSKDLNIHDTGRLVVRFKDVPIAELPPPPPKATDPAARPGETTTPPVAVAVAPSTSADPPLAPSGPAPLSPPGTPPAAPTTKKAGGTAPATADKAEAAAETEPARPLDLSARSVDVLMLRSPERSQVKEVYCTGDVHVHQDPDPKHPDDKGVFIQGDSLYTLYKPEGQYLLVKGDLAQLRLDKIYVVAPEVHIDQAVNKTWAYCPGAMTIESTTNFNGEALASPELLTVHWGESMLVFGDYAEFHGNVLADQKSPKARQEDDPTSRMACDALQLFFDRPISLKGESRSEPQPKVRNLVCDRNVQVEQITFEEIVDKDGKFLAYGKLIKKQYISCVGLTEESTPLVEGVTTPRTSPGPTTGTGAAKPAPAPTSNEVNASGPGLVRSFGPGGGDPMGDSSTSKPDNKPRPGETARPDNKPRPAEASRPDNKPRPADNKGQPAQASKKPPEEQETKLTTIEFRSRMYANNQRKTAMFWGAVRVLDLPSKDPDQKVDIDAILANMPTGSLYLNCAHLTVLDRGEPGQPKREMKAVGRVLVQGPDFWGRAETVTYNEEKDQLIFDGGETGQAVLARKAAPGVPPEGDLHGKRITYIKSTGDYKIDGGHWMSGRPH
jgi:hypothetical protein